MSFCANNCVIKREGAAIWRLLVVIGLFFVLPQARAMTFVQPAGDVIGELQYVVVKQGESLAAIARRFDVGLSELKVANPKIDPAKPGAGTKVLIPSRYILPHGTREGIVVNLAELRLYFYHQPEQGPALVSTYPISVGHDGRKVAEGQYEVVQRLRKPNWTVPEYMKEQALLAGKEPMAVIEPGENNPLGEYAMSLTASDCLIHGTNQPANIGIQVKHGCFAMYPEDIEVLVRLAQKGTPVRVMSESFKYGRSNGAVYLELQRPEGERRPLNMRVFVNRMTQLFPNRMWAEDWERLRQTADAGLGVAMPVIKEGPAKKSAQAWWIDMGRFKDLTYARDQVNKIERLDLPVMLRDCTADGSCQLVAGPFQDLAYLQEVTNKIKWVTRIVGKRVPYRETPVFTSAEKLATLSE